MEHEENVFASGRASANTSMQQGPKDDVNFGSPGIRILVESEMLMSHV